MKYEIEQVIHYMRDNKPHSAPILARMRVENLHQDWAHTKEQKGLFMPFGEAGVFYSTCHGIVKENEAYASAGELGMALCSA